MTNVHNWSMTTVSKMFSDDQVAWTSLMIGTLFASLTDDSKDQWHWCCDDEFLQLCHDFQWHDQLLAPSNTARMLQLIWFWHLHIVCCTALMLQVLFPLQKSSQSPLKKCPSVPSMPTTISFARSSLGLSTIQHDGPTCCASVQSINHLRNPLMDISKSSTIFFSWCAEESIVIVNESLVCLDLACFSLRFDHCTERWALKQNDMFVIPFCIWTHLLKQNICHGCQQHWWTPCKSQHFWSMSPSFQPVPQKSTKLLLQSQAC